MSNVRFEPARRLRGTITPPADKSVSHRAALLGAMCPVPLRIENYLRAHDTMSTLGAVAQLGALVEDRGEEIVIRGGGMREVPNVLGSIDVGNAGTLMRLLPGWLAAQEGRSFTLDGDDSIRRRPVDRIAEPLRLMGAQLEATRGRFPPFVLTGGKLSGIRYELPVASAQVKSCVLIAGVAAENSTTVVEPHPSRDHTERMVMAAGVPISREGAQVTVRSSDEMLLDRVRVPGDPSSAAFMIAAAILVPRSRLLVLDVAANWTRAGFIEVARRMGAIVLGDLEAVGLPLVADEPLTDLDVAAGSLVGTTVEPHEVALVIDELPLVALLGCFAEGETIVRGAQELKVKESNRIDTVVNGLQGLGADIEATDDGFVVRGTDGLRGGVIEAHGDHRIAMLGAVAGLASRDGVEVRGMEAAAVSYPGFIEDLRGLISA